MIQSQRNMHTLWGQFSHRGRAEPVSLPVHLQLTSTFLKQRYNQATKPLFFYMQSENLITQI